MKAKRTEREQAYHALVAVRMDPAWHIYMDEETKQIVADAIRRMEENNNG